MATDTRSCTVPSPIIANVHLRRFVPHIFAQPRNPSQRLARSLEPRPYISSPLATDAKSTSFFSTMPDTSALSDAETIAPSTARTPATKRFDLAVLSSACGLPISGDIKWLLDILGDIERRKARKTKAEMTKVKTEAKEECTKAREEARRAWAEVAKARAEVKRVKEEKEAEVRKAWGDAWGEITRVRTKANEERAWRKDEAQA
ncbi:hypothetical protein OF83DRAFT_219465, partial [Amylostereum chailletii]